MFSTDLRLRTPGGLLTYPDDMVVRGGVELSAVDRLDTVMNPTALIEVLSESTWDYDRGEKLNQYQRIPTLRDCILIEQTRVYVEHYSIANAVKGSAALEWIRQEYSATAESAVVASLGLAIPLSEVYSRIDSNTR